MLEALLTNRTLGCEFECAVPIIGAGETRDVQQAISEVLNKNGIRACSRAYSHQPVPNRCDIVVETDGSIVGEQRYEGVRWAQIEFKTRVLSGMSDWERIVPPTLEMVRYCGGKITPSCGHHVHVGFPEFAGDPSRVRSLWNLIHRFEPTIFGLVAPSRRVNTYCKPLPPAAKYLHGANSVRTIKQRLSHFDRYHGLNLTHIFSDSPRIEFRYSHGTLDAAKARAWETFCTRLVDHAVTRTCQAAPAPLTNDRRSLEKLLVTVGLKVNTKVYSTVSDDLRLTGRHLLKRWKHFNGQIPLAKKPPAKAMSSEITLE